MLRNKIEIDVRNFTQLQPERGQLEVTNYNQHLPFVYCFLTDQTIFSIGSHMGGKKETTLSLMFPSSFSVRVLFPCIILGQTCLNGNTGCLLPIKGTEDYSVPNVGVTHMWTFVCPPHCL